MSMSSWNQGGQTLQEFPNSACIKQGQEIGEGNGVGEEEPNNRSSFLKREPLKWGIKAEKEAFIGKH